MKTSKIIFDIECDSLKPTKIHCIVAKELGGSIHKFTPTKIDEGIKFLENADVLVGHNILSYDIPVIKKLTGVDLSNKDIEDTLVMSRLFYPIRENGHSLKTWGYRVNFVKQEQPLDFEVFTPQMLEYCVNDVMLNELVYLQLAKEGKGFDEKSIELEHQVAKVIADQEANGFKFDEKKATMLLAELKTKMNEVTDEVQQTFKPRMVDIKLVTPKFKKDGELSKSGLRPEEYNRLIESGDYSPFMRQELQEFNLGSRKQIGEYLIDFGWKPNRFTPTGQPIVDEGTLKKITHIHEAKLIADFLLYQKRIAQVQSWIDAVEEDGRVHGSVIPNGTITGRMSHSHPNVAQVPAVYSPFGKECRSCWTVDEGNVLLGVDASGLELRMLAHYMDDKDYINEVINGDIHTTNQNLAGIESRDKAKTFIYALVYGAGNAKIGQVVGGNRTAGKQLRDRFLTNLPSLKKLTDRVQQASRRGFLKGLDGRKIYVRSEHAALNTLLQGGGAIVMKKGLVLLDQILKLNAVDYKFVANIHDEWQIEVKENQADFVGNLAVENLIKAGEYFNLRCPLDGEYKIGRSWYDTH
jgi:DNA polymerase I-like protein with 3'-5' exonuclease and polymerase domains|tara:strand:- start:2457 stop:4196 length:1740 start_codon:yes stop_codon:yes gene_type:complete